MRGRSIESKPASEVARSGDRSRADKRSATFPLEVAAVWVLFAVVALEILVTYTHLPAHDLYHVSGSGFTGGSSRVLVFLNYPLALVAIPILAILAERLASGSLRILASIGIVLSAAVYWPGVVTESDLDARTVNAIAALGVLIALALTLVAASRLGRPTPLVLQPGDRLRVALAIIVFGLGLPWIGADMGFHLDGVPVLGTLYQTGALRAQPGVAGLHPAVHYGHHHGLDGVLLVLSALLLSRLLSSVGLRWLRLSLGAYLALMLCYGAGNIANDIWLEQVVKRGWTDWEIPNVTTPKASLAWAVIVLSAAGLYGAALWRTRRSSGGLVSPSPETA